VDGAGAGLTCVVLANGDGLSTGYALARANLAGFSWARAFLAFVLGDDVLLQQAAVICGTEPFRTERALLRPIRIAYSVRALPKPGETG
jgi:hypothetical protein